MKFIPIFDIPKKEIQHILLIKGHSVCDNNGNFLYTYNDKLVTVFKNADFWANNSMAVYKNSIVLDTYLSQSIFERYNNQKINLKNKQTLKFSNITCLGDYPYGIYYHFMVDSLPRIYALHKTNIFGLSRLDVVIPDFIPTEFKNILINLLPENTNVVWTDPKLNTLIHADYYYHLPHLTEESRGYLPKEVINFLKVKLTEILKVKWPTTNNKNIYISRQKAPKRKFKDDALLLEMLNKHNFETYYLEDLTVKSQIELFASAKNIISIHGAGLTNLLWTTRANVLEIFPSPNQNAWQYEYMCIATKNNYQKITLDEPTINDNIVANQSLLSSISNFINLCAE